ncbi:hypothetical protein F5Y09DRAFT_101178 [Xylaria sp. FL1042]|nr:hypothetical protein F5Y09DRAFT_101178 [Xylaria sp. FL1042]
MDFIPLVNQTLQLLSVYVTLLKKISHVAGIFTHDSLFYTRTYGLGGLYLYLYGDRSIWKLQTEVVNLDDDNVAFNLKKLVQDESQMVAIAASIIVQISITALSLESLSHAHWTARGFFVLSLVSATMAVYSASSQYRIFCRCVSAEHIKEWIKTYARLSSFAPKLPSPERFNPEREGDSETGVDPMAFEITVPPMASVVLISAPFELLVLSLHSFLIGFGIWLGFVWTRDLDQDAAQGDSRAVFITYAVGLGVCYIVYTLSDLYGEPQESLSTWVDELRKRIPRERKAKTAGPDHDYGREQSGQQQYYGAPQPIDPIMTPAQGAGSFNEEISNSLRLTARLRRELAESEERLADLYNRHTQ